MTGLLTAFDWFLVAVVALSTLTAFFRGFVRVLFSFGGVVVGFVVASWYYLVLAPRLTFLPTTELREIAAFFLITAAITIAFSFAAGWFRKAISVAGLGVFDRILGGLFGFVRGVLLGAGFMLLFATFVPEWEPFAHSRLAPYFLSGAHAVFSVVPGHFQQRIADGAAYLLQQSSTLFQTKTPVRTR